MSKSPTQPAIDESGERDLNESSDSVPGYNGHPAGGDNNAKRDEDHRGDDEPLERWTSSTSLHSQSQNMVVSSSTSYVMSVFICVIIASSPATAASIHVSPGLVIALWHRGKDGSQPAVIALNHFVHYSACLIAENVWISPTPDV